ncbi:MAG TPA: hypothetical protein VHY35_03080 [Stellaceae bacterium]|jgi:hypothetical protein|nr:hypothetical protein [Stellaceae bacterium]
MEATVIQTRGSDGAVAAVVEGPAEGPIPAISWSAVIGGAFLIAATGIIIVALGAGFGLSSVSPWPGSGVSATTFTVMTAIWLIIAQWLSSGIGGYVAGRLSTTSPLVHADEAYFRDTAHGVLAWALAAVVTIGLMGSAVTSLIGGTARTVATVASGAVQGGAQGATQNGIAALADPNAYLVDTLYRTDKPGTDANGQQVRAETTRILLSGLRSGGVPDADKTYLAQLVSARTGISQDEAKKRVDDVIAKAKDAETKARQAADEARKAAVHLSLFIAFSMLVGAFISGVAAKIGGHRRDLLTLR